MIAGDCGFDDARPVAVCPGRNGEEGVTTMLAYDRERRHGRWFWRGHRRRTPGGMPGDRVTDDGAQFLLVHRYRTG